MVSYKDGVYPIPLLLIYGLILGFQARAYGYFIKEKGIMSVIFAKNVDDTLF
jgi:hypothetical protein